MPEVWLWVLHHLYIKTPQRWCKSRLQQRQVAPRLFLAANDFHGNVRFGLLGNDLPRLPHHLLGDAIVLARGCHVENRRRVSSLGGDSRHLKRCIMIYPTGYPQYTKKTS